jgi:hypothetical protein
VLGEDSHPVLAGEKPEAERVLAVAAVADRGRDLAVVVESKPDATPVLDGATKT